MNQQNNIIKQQQNHPISTNPKDTEPPHNLNVIEPTNHNNFLNSLQQSAVVHKQSAGYQNTSQEGLQQLDSLSKIKVDGKNQNNLFLNMEEKSDEYQQIDQVNSLGSYNKNVDNNNFSVTPDHFTVSKVERLRQNQQYSSVKSDNFPITQIYFKPIEIQLPPPITQSHPQQQQVDGIIPCTFSSIVKQKIQLKDQSISIKQEQKQVNKKQEATKNNIVHVQVKQKQKQEIDKQQKSKIITDMLLQKINQLQNKVKSLEQQKKQNQQFIKSSSQYQSTPNSKLLSYGSIKKNSNDLAKKFSTVTETQETNSNSNFRIKSVVNKALSVNQQYRIYSNIYSMTVNQSRNQNITIKQQLNLLKQKLKIIQNSHNFNDDQIKNNLKNYNNTLLKNSRIDVPSASPSRKDLGGKIVRRSNSNSKLQNNDFSQRTKTQQSLYEQAEKGFIRTGPQNFLQNDSKTIQHQKFSNLFDQQRQNSRKKVDSSAIFRKNPGPAIIHKNKFDGQPQYFTKSNTLEVFSERERIGADSRETQSLLINKNQRSASSLSSNIHDIIIPQLVPYPTPQSTSQVLIQIGKLTFKKLGFQISQYTILNVKKFKNCVLFSIGSNENILWHYEGRFYYGGWKTFSNGQGQKSGNGIQYVPGKYKYKGTFSDGKRSGFGTMIGQNQSAYIGYWSQGFKHGKGKFIQSDGSEYQGDWKFGKKNGNGKIYNNKKLQFEGKFEGGYKNGFGKQYFENGDYYQGNYLNNKFDGKGSYLWASKALYIGQFKDGKRNGHGVWRSGQKNYDTYQGQYMQDNKNGYGVYKWANGAVYKGSFKDDLKHGQGTLTYENGKTVSMVWNKGNMEKTINNSQYFDSAEKKNQNMFMTPKNNIRKQRIGVRSSKNLQSAKSLKSDRSLPKGLSLKKEKQHHHHSNHPQQKVQFRTRQQSSDFGKFKISNDMNINRQLINKQSLVAGPLKDPPYKSMQTSSNVNMNL